VTIKFNFYDIYGFALPGFLLLAVLWLPFGLIDGKWPDAQFSSALLGIILAYIAGHVLQGVAEPAIPSNFMGGRFPSVVFLDKEDSTFTSEVKERLAKQIKAVFQLDVSPELPPDLSKDAEDKFRKKVDDLRGDAFFLCRSALIKSKTVIYAEQFQGLYALMRGLCAAFGIAVAYYLGWAYSSLLQPIKTFRFVPPSWWSWQWSGLVFLAGIVIALAGLVFGDRHKYFKWLADKDRSRSVTKYSKWAMIVAILLAVFAAGYNYGLSRAGSAEHRGQLIAAAVLSFLASERCYAGYKAFAREFAKAVYRDFSNYEKPAGGHNADPNPDAEPES
jgi:hypothetical protein